jgi:hypothetical protein
MNVMPISVLRSSWGLAVVFAVIKFGAGTSGQVLYNFVRVTNPDLIQARGAPSLNESGKVAFGGFDASFHQGIFSGNGSEMQFSDYTKITLEPAVTVDFFGSYVSSRVIFSGTVNGKQGVYNSDGVSIETIIIDPTIKSFFSQRPLMNARGNTRITVEISTAERGGFTSRKMERATRFIPSQRAPRAVRCSSAVCSSLIRLPFR